ncbi:MAG: metallophosphoesterase [Opitutaceae bacterium]|nr:metallophosphoesterase [Opitutaceae bacterium]
MRILHVSDFHFQKRWFDWLLEEAPRADLVCFTGDFLDMGSDVAMETQVEWVRSWLERFTHPLIFCSGNHDLLPNDRTSSGYVDAEWLRGIDNPNIHGDGSTITFGGVPILSRGFMDTPPVLPETFSILLSHEGPAESDVSRDHCSDWGDYELLEVLKQREARSLVLCGHVHEPIRASAQVGWSIALNTGANMLAEIPNHHVVNLSRGSVMRFANGGYLPLALNGIGG